VTPMDNSKTHKEGVSHTYKGFDGYAPMMAYIGTEGFLVNTELREGSQHCQCNTPAFLKQPMKKRRRIRTVIGNLIQIAGHVTTRGRRIILAIGCSNVWRHVFMDVYNRFALA